MSPTSRRRPTLRATVVYSDNLETSMVSLRRSGSRAAGCISRVRATRKSDTASRWPFVRIWRQERGKWSELLKESGRWGESCWRTIMVVGVVVVAGVGWGYRDEYDHDVNNNDNAGW